MEEEKDKNINFLPDDLKSKKSKTLDKIKADDYEPEMIRPDSSKLKKAKISNLSGSDVSFFQKISNWFGDKFSFAKSKKDEKPRIQELQELVGKNQHVGEVMINDEEVLPDEERDEVVKRETGDLEESEQGPEKEKLQEPTEDEEQEKVQFITKEDHEAQLLREKDKAQNQEEEEKDKNIAKAQDISLHPDKNIKIPKADDGIYSMPESTEEINLPEPAYSEDSEAHLKEVEKLSLDSKSELSGPSFWDKIKLFFSGLFGHKEKKSDQKELEAEESVLSYELRKFAKEKEAEEEHVVSTPVENFAEGVKVMEQGVNSPIDEGHKDPAVEETSISGQGQGKEELIKAQEELFSEVPEQSAELEDIFSPVDEKSEEKPQEPEEIAQVSDEKVSFWGKIKNFFAGLFAHKAKIEEVNIDQETLTSQLEEVSEEKSQEAEIQPEEKPQVPVANYDQETLTSQPEEVSEEKSQEAEIQPEEKPQEPTEEAVSFSMPEDQGVQESLPESLTNPEVEESVEPIPEQQELTDQPLPEESSKVSFWDKIKAFFRKIFGLKAKEIDLQEDAGGIDQVAQYGDNEKDQPGGKKNVLVHKIVMQLHQGHLPKDCFRR